jgi:hypothetical protein
MASTWLHTSTCQRRCPGPCRSSSVSHRMAVNGHWWARKGYLLAAVDNRGGGLSQKEHCLLCDRRGGMELCRQLRYHPEHAAETISEWKGKHRRSRLAKQKTPCPVDFEKAPLRPPGYPSWRVRDTARRATGSSSIIISTSALSQRFPVGRPAVGQEPGVRFQGNLDRTVIGREV